jgi:hypothetical protein
VTDTDQFMHDHQAQIDEAAALSRYGRTHPDEREACADKLEAIYDALEEEAQEDEE